MREGLDWEEAEAEEEGHGPPSSPAPDSCASTRLWAGTGSSSSCQSSLLRPRDMAPVGLNLKTEVGWLLRVQPACRGLRSQS